MELGFLPAACRTLAVQHASSSSSAAARQPVTPPRRSTLVSACTPTNAARKAAWVGTTATTHRGRCAARRTRRKCVSERVSLDVKQRGWQVSLNKAQQQALTMIKKEGGTCYMSRLKSAGIPASAIFNLIEQGYLKAPRVGVVTITEKGRSA